MMVSAPPVASLVLIAWSRVWSPVAPEAWFKEAWRALDLPDDDELRDVAFCSQFHVGIPAPRAPLMLHAALNRPGDLVRMEWMRVMAHLGLKPGADMLQPDHLAVACEVLAQAVAREEDLIVRELWSRYMAPWCDVALMRLSDQDPRLHRIVEQFREGVVHQLD